MANWLRVKKDGNKLMLPINGIYDILEYEGDNTKSIIQKYGNDCAKGGMFWGSVFTLGGLIIYKQWLKHKQKKEEEKSEEQEDGAE